MKTTKVCTKCREEKDLSEFYNRTKSKDGKGFRCKSCITVIMQNSHNPALSREKALVKNYGITHEQYEEMLERQSHKCAICESAEHGLRKEAKHWPIDHCHKTNLVRGVLCTNCNQALGYFKDDITILENAINYLDAAEIEILFSDAAA